jgi:hypothetical protein
MPERLSAKTRECFGQQAPIDGRPAGERSTAERLAKLLAPRLAIPR